MLEKPAISDETIIAGLWASYQLQVIELAFLPLGVDVNAAVYRALAADGTAYFVKLRWGVFDPTAVTLPRFLSDQGIRQIIAPLATATGGLWANLDTCKLILYPFVEGHNGYETRLSDQHWRDLGMALKRIHTTSLPLSLTRRLPQETYTPTWREMVKTFLVRVEQAVFDDPIVQDLAQFLQANRGTMLDLIQRAERYAQTLQAQTPDPVVCHADLHAGNVLIGVDGSLYIVDWDAPILAFKERDLMFVGGRLFGGDRTPAEEEALFYQGYGPTQINPVALAYYRYERIIQDIAAFGEQLWVTTEGGDDRAQALRYLKSNFLPGDIIDIAYKSDNLEVCHG